MVAAKHERNASEESIGIIDAAVLAVPIVSDFAVNGLPISFPRLFETSENAEFVKYDKEHSV